MQSKESKAAQIALWDDLFAKATSLVLTNFSGLSAEKLTILRRRFKEAGVSYRVAKNTLARRALVGKKLELISEFFKGPVAVAISQEDPAAPAKVLVKTLKEKDFENLKIIAAAVEGSVLKPEQLDDMAKIPGKNELRATLLGLMTGVPSGFVRLLNEVPSGFVRVLAQREKQLEEQAQPAVN